MAIIDHNHDDQVDDDDGDDHADDNDNGDDDHVAMMGMIMWMTNCH